MVNSALGDPEYVWRLLIASGQGGKLLKRRDVEQVLLKHSGCSIRWAKRVIQLGTEKGCWIAPDGRTRAYGKLARHPDGTELLVRSLEEREVL